MVSKLMTHKEAVERFVRDGDYLAYDCNYFQRGPSSLIREIIRQRKKKLWLCGKFTYVACALLVEAGCADRIDIGFIGFGPWIARAVREKKCTIYEYSNALMTLRLKAGAMGVPFLPARSFGGTDGFQHSGCKIVEDPFTGKPVLLAPGAQSRRIDHPRASGRRVRQRARLRHRHRARGMRARVASE